MLETETGSTGGPVFPRIDDLRLCYDVQAVFSASWAAMTMTWPDRNLLADYQAWAQVSGLASIGWLRRSALTLAVLLLGPRCVEARCAK